MAVTVGMKLVFRLGEVGFTLAVDRLIALREIEVDSFDPSSAGSGRFHLGTLNLRGEEIEVRDLAGRLRLPAGQLENGQGLLVVSGQGAPWSFPVDRIDGVYPDAEFELREIGAFFLDPRDRLYERLALWRRELLVPCDPERIERCWEQT